MQMQRTGSVLILSVNINATINTVLKFYATLTLMLTLSVNGPLLSLMAKHRHYAACNTVNLTLSYKYPTATLSLHLYRKYYFV